MIEFLKDGNKIRIKKSKRGSFTRWCGGEVTDECIKKGKNSSDSAIRKKAVFAENARKWCNGGIVIAEDGANTKNFFQKIGNFIQPQLINTALNGISGIVSANKQSKAADQYAEAKNEEMKSFKTKTWADNYKEALKNQNDRSDIVNMSRAYNQTSGDVAQEVQEKQQQINKEIAQKYQEAFQNQSWTDLIQGLSQLNNNKKVDKKVDTPGISLTTSDFWTTPNIYMNSYSDPNTFWNM